MSNMSILMFVRTILLLCVLIPSLVICYRAGTPGIDYPNYLRAPRTGFTCKGRGNGYFSDQEAGCQAYHVCDNGRKYSFVCPVSTLFSDSVKTCDYWYNVRCGGRNTEDERPERPEQPEPSGIPEGEQPDPDIERPAEVENEPDRNPEASDDRPIRNPDNELPDDRTSTGPSISPSPPENSGGIGEAEPEEENEAPEDESPESGPDVVPGNPMDGSVPNEWRRRGGSGPSGGSNQWTTYPTTMKDSMTTGPTKWKMFGTTTRSVNPEPSSTADNNVDSGSDQTTKTNADTSSSTTSNPEVSSLPDSESEGGDEFRKENWMEQGMPSPANESDNDNMIEGGSGSNVTQDPVANVSVSSGEGRRQPAASDANESGLIGSMMKWAAAANSALSLRQAEPKVTQTNGGAPISEPKGPNPYIPFEERQRRARAPHVPHQTDPTVTNPSPSSASSPNPPYTYPYEPSLNPSMAVSGMHVSLNERKVYTRDSSRRSGDDNKRSASPSESADHPNPWTFPLTDQETAEAAAKPRDTYRSRRRDDPFDVSHRSKTNAKTGSAFDMMMATTTTATPTSPKTTSSSESTTASYVNGVTERLTAQTKSGTQSKKPGNFVTGEVMPNGQCRCPLPESDVYVS